MRVNVSFECDNAAFDGRVDVEAAHVIRTVADRLERGDESGAIFDLNGNRIGAWELSEPLNVPCAECGKPQPLAGGGDGPNVCGHSEGGRMCPGSYRRPAKVGG